MKIIGLVLAGIIFAYYVRAQTVEEWTQQKETAIKRLVEQIIANQVFIEHVKSGIKIVSGGLHTIRDIKNGEFKLHLGYFDSLKIVNPKIKSSVKVAEIVSLQLRIVNVFKESLTSARLSAQFTNVELSYCVNVVNEFLKGCIQVVDDLMLVITSGQLAMTDDERLQRINRIYLIMQERFAFACAFGNDLKLLSTQRFSEQSEINYLKK